MAKRVADTYLTHDNYNDEDDETDEVDEGSFQLASSEALNTRDIKKAKRRIVQNTGLSTTKGAFQAFTGLTGTKSVTGPTFAFGSMSNAPFTQLGSAATTNPPKTSADVDFTRVSSTSTISSQPSASKPPTIAGFSFGNKDQRFAPMAKNDEAPPSSSSYLSELSKLNQSALKWIEQHVESEPTCILSPIFADYNRYIEELEKKYPLENNATATTGSFVVASSGNSIPSSTSFSFGLKSTGLTAVAPTTIAGNLFGVQAVPGSSGGGFFGTFPALGAAGSTTSTTAITSAGAGMNSAQTGEGDEDYVPEKPVVVEVKEDDAFYSVRCKLFYKKETAWVERGVGNLFLKPIDGGKTQLLVRADTNLGNILLNIMLGKSIKVSRMNSNNVTIFCVPNPPIDPKVDDKTPVAMLIRVKNGEQADELIDKLNSSIN